MNQPSTRQSNFELLRILSIFGILCLHMSGIFTFSPNAIDHLQVNIIGLFNICVTCFVLISGYFGITRNGEKLFHLWCIVIFYSLLSILIYNIFHIPMTLEDTVKSIFPTISGKYWFFSAYLILSLFAPYINKFIESLSQKQFSSLLLLLIFVFYFIPTFCYFGITKDNGKGIIHVLIIYMIGRYIALYKKNLKVKSKTLFFLYIGITILFVLLNQTASLIKGSYFQPFARDNTLTVLAAALCIFFLFSRMHFNSKIVNSIAVNTFAIYIFEEVFRYLLVNNFCTETLWGTPHIIPFILISAFVIYILCNVIEYIRKKIFFHLEAIIYQRLSFLYKKILNK